MAKILEVCESTRETRKKLEKKSDEEIIDILKDVDQSIKNGNEFAIDYQRWSVGSDILRKRGYEILGPSDLYNL